MVRVNSFTQRAPLPDSPSRQLILELTRDLEHVRIHGEELKRVKAYESRSFHERLDQIDREREEIHTTALNAAAAKRDRRRQHAEETLKHHLQAVEEERKRKEELERRRLEKLRQEKAEKERKEREEAARLEAEEKARQEAERARKLAEEEKARRELEKLEQEKLEQEKKKRAEDDERKRKEEEAAKKKAAGEAARQAAESPTQSVFSGIKHRTPKEIQEHERYLSLHRHLKEFRNYMKAQTKVNPLLKQHMGDMRRTIRKCVGQLVNEDKVANRKPTQEIATTLNKAKELAEPSVDIRQFIAFPPPQIANIDNPNVPALWVYLLNILAKSILAQLMAEAGVSTKSAEPLGVLTAQIFSMDVFCFNGQTMIDILLAKFRFLCPVLWGFYGDQTTDEGKKAVGWIRDESTGPFVSVQLHEERMAGLGAGFAAIALRNFAKSPRQNPYPNNHYWNALSKIINVPPAEVQLTHLVVLAAMLRHSTARIVNFWGDMGVLALRQAIVKFPAGLPKKSTQRAIVEDLRDMLARENRVVI